MEQDTGATCTLMSKSMHEQLWPVVSERPMLYLSCAKLRVYGGSKLKAAGEIVTAKIGYSPKFCSAKIIIVDGEGPCLLGRDLIQSLGLCSNITKYLGLSLLRKSFQNCFQKVLDATEGRNSQLRLTRQVPPKFCKARTVPYTMREKVDKELDRLQEEDIISPVTNSSWAAAVVPVLKPNSTVGLCGDYKLTVNKAARLDTYLIPTLDDLFSGLSDGSMLSKLDMSQAYAQLCLDKESKKYTVISILRGVFKYNRLSFGISSALGIFQ